MWSHYADEHCGFCLGFRFSKKITNYNEQNKIVASDDVIYTKENPYLDYFTEFAKRKDIPKWDELWQSLFQIGLQTKSYPWKYEREVRVIRKVPGTVSFVPLELVEVIFGLNMSDKNQSTILNIISGPEWKHVCCKKVIRKGHNFNIDFKEIK
jgi:hypothetical protein